MAVSHEKESTCSQLKLIKTHGFIATGAHLITELQITFFALEPFKSYTATPRSKKRFIIH